MKLFLTTIFCVVIAQLNAQQFYFSKENYKDSTTLAAAMPALATQVMQAYSDAEKSTYYDNMFRYAIIARKYNEALLYIDSVRNLARASDSAGINGVGFQWETYARTRLELQAGEALFENVYKKIFIENYRNLSKAAKAIAGSYASTEIPPLKDNLEKLINAQATNDSLNLSEARTFIRAYNAYVAYSLIIPVIKPVLSAEDNKYYNIEKALIKTKDGSILQALVVRKKDAKGKLPTVFLFNIYIDSAYDIADAKPYADAGFAGVVANTRGKGISPQTIEPFEHDASDAYDIIDWISKQPWSNKKVGMTGGSYLGFSQWAAAKTLHPALKTIMPEVAVGIGIDYPMFNNVFMSYMLTWIHYVTNNKQTDYVDFNNRPHWDSLQKKWYREGASFRSLDTLEGRPNAIFQRWLQHPSFDSYWQNMTSYNHDFSKINIPVLTTTGYFDDDQCGAMYYYREHYLHNTNANNYLVIGPYTHYGAQSTPIAEVSGYKVDSVATTFNFYDLSIQWFNYVLKDSAKPTLLKDKVNYEVMGANEWKHASALNKMSNDTLTFYLGNTRVNDNYKLEDTSNKNDFIKQEVDFKDRSDTTDNHKYLNIDSVLFKNNSLTFTTQPLDKPVIVNGSFVGELQAAINKKDIDIFVNMYEQMPNGKYFALGYTYLRASYAKNSSVRQLLEPGKKEMIPVNNSYITCKQLSKGSRLIIVLSISKENDLQINYGSGKDVSDETIADAGEPLQIKWFGDSYIKMPVWK